MTIAIALLLVLLGAGGFWATGAKSPTALIPAVFGMVLFMLGVLARDERKRKVAMHLAVVFGLLGFVGSAKGLLDVPALLMGQPLERPAASISRAIMALLTAVFVGLCVRSFIKARQDREATR